MFDPEQVREYQLFLSTEKQLAPGSIGIAVSALRSLYRVTPRKDWDIPEIRPAPGSLASCASCPAPGETGQFLGCVTSTNHGAILTACYAAGLRISEAVSLRPADIDSPRMVIRVEQGKGAKDRYVMLSPRLLEILRDYWRRTRPEGEWLFPGLIPGRHIRKDAVELACRKALELSGMDKPITPHSLRHPCSRRHNAQNR